MRGDGSRGSLVCVAITTARGDRTERDASPRSRHSGEATPLIWADRTRRSYWIRTAGSSTRRTGHMTTTQASDNELRALALVASPPIQRREPRGLPAVGASEGLTEIVKVAE